jgi:glycosyltransferase involved in cell wall biosynthesis
MLSVLISVYEGDDPAHLDAALASLWEAQTRRPDEIVLVRDGPVSEGLAAVLARWQDRLGPGFRFVPLASNGGLARALNHGLAACRHGLVARADADDLSLPDRFARQVAFMEARPDLAASSAWVEEFDETLRRPGGLRAPPAAMPELAAFAKLRSPLNHPAAIFRKAAVEAVGGYPILASAQDYGLWSLLLQRGYRLGNLPEVHVRMRAGSTFLHRRGAGYLVGERELLRFQRQIGFLSRRQYVASLLVRFGLRHSPGLLRRGLYALARQ